MTKLMLVHFSQFHFYQASLFFTIIGIINSVFLWPVVLLLYFTEIGSR